jgi:hypothetical protein
MRLVDAPPTILYALGQAVPAHWEGRVLDQIFEADRLRTSPVRIGTGAEGSVRAAGIAPAGGGFSPEDEESIAERLRGLGYLE